MVLQRPRDTAKADCHVKMIQAFAVRIAMPADEDAVTILLDASYATLLPPTYGTRLEPPVLALMSKANPTLLASGRFFVAQTPEGVLVGCGGWSPERPGSGETEPGLAHIRHFATHPDWLGKGVGRQLYAWCERSARVAGAERFECYSSLNAEPFYAALGFSRVRPITLDMAAAGRLDGILMMRAL